jgi:L-serine dehydratase
MFFEALDRKDQVTDSWKVYSVGGGALREEGEKLSLKSVYDLSTFSDVMGMCENSGLSYWEYVQRCEGEGIWDFLIEIWSAMKAAIIRGLTTEGILPGGLVLPRKASQIHKEVLTKNAEFKQTGLLSAYAMAVAEENASGGIIVTAPTCGAAGIIPSVIKYVQETTRGSDKMILRGLATAGLIGTVIKTNGSISGAQVGCQGEVGSACAMAAGAAAQMLGGSLRQIEYAAEMGLEHHLGLTCDPVDGLVQIPCIERNAHAASRALSCAQLSLLSDGSHRIPFDDAVAVMKQTGIDMPSLYRETAKGGLANVFRQQNRNPRIM